MSNRTRLKEPAYVGQIRADTQRYLHDLLEENAVLRALVGDLEDENRRLHERITPAIDGEAQRIEARRARVVEIEAEGRRLADRYAAVAQQNADLANLHVAFCRLHASLDRERVVAAIHEIVTCLLGCEEFAVFDVASNGRPSPAFWCGVDLEDLHQLCVDDGILGDVVLHGDSFINEQIPRSIGPLGELPITACVSMKLDGRITGVLVLFRMAAQKTRIHPMDREILDLLAAHAASALFVTRCYAMEMPTRRPPAYPR